ncbi:hypothetical protein K491DRAFT_80816 [Lophiostoma macrostomum CBS 122681]|uniref:MYND-type domain-containing protein n=1 Tax=Lophiostoma macrostomum CBS 122681 TaxID=1314788 RepID=A0A6A6TKX8_9PLEO|nr:hypothetical protein K491DRAFT_80816 [Lophiostoma macrostomum CBS 122681]
MATPYDLEVRSAQKRRARSIYVWSTVICLFWAYCCLETLCGEPTRGAVDVAPAFHLASARVSLHRLAMECGPSGATIDAKIAEWKRFRDLEDERLREETATEYGENYPHRLALFLSGLSADDLARFKSLEIHVMEPATAIVVSENAEAQQQSAARHVEEQQLASRANEPEKVPDGCSTLHVEQPPATGDTNKMRVSPTLFSSHSETASHNADGKSESCAKSSGLAENSPSNPTLETEHDGIFQPPPAGQISRHATPTSPTTGTQRESGEVSQPNPSEPNHLGTGHWSTTSPSPSQSSNGSILRGTPTEPQATRIRDKDDTEVHGSTMGENVDPTGTTSSSTRHSSAEMTSLPSIELNVSQARPCGKPASTLDTVSSRKCNMCPSEGVLLCEGCNTISYCSEACRKDDSSAHRLLCSTWNDFQTPSEQECRRAIIIPENGRISFVWLEFHQNRNDDGQRYDIPLLGPHFVNKSARVTHSMKDNPILGRQLANTVNLVTIAEGDSPYLEVNETVAGLIDAKFAHKWKGLILVYGTEGTAEPLPRRRDLDLHDFRHALDYVNTYNSTAIASDLRYFGPTVRGVRVNCDGEIAASSVKRFEEVRIPLTHAIFRQTSLLPNANKVGIPICKTEYPRTINYERSIEEYNPGSIVRNIPNQQDWNASLRDLEVPFSMEWDEKGAKRSTNPLDVPWVKQFYQGNAILARLDQKPLYSEHVDALWVFAKYYLEPKMTLASEIHNDMNMNDVDKEITPEKFALYWCHMHTFLRSRHHPVVPSPYEVKKRHGTLKRKRPKGFAMRSKRGKWEWTSDGDEDDLEKIED